MTKLRRPVHGPRPIAALVPVVTRDAFKRTAPAVAQLMEAWGGIVGPVLAEVTTPRHLAQGTLTIGCSGPVAMELQHLSMELLNRINQYLGSQTVRRLRLVQTAAVRTPPRVSRTRPTEAVAVAASEAVAHLPDGPLRAALTALGSAVLTESASRLGNQPRTR
jgi:hypothetical protein